jgi:hypothetical protein
MSTVKILLQDDPAIVKLKIIFLPFFSLVFGALGYSI